ncbi:CHAP domain-containing protein [Streptosporangium sp. NPDC004379]|uniref:CHAP domain-containing protein n=1 Tax=Streptosporangium sp. NPDC004379 TaxID=3366189 RepID=UPI0036898ACE
MAKNRLTPGKHSLVRALVGASIVLAGGAVTTVPALADNHASGPQAGSVTENAAASSETQAQNLPKVSAQQVLDIAAQQIGVSENAYGGGTKFHAWYLASERAKETVARDGGRIQDYANAPWCAMFVSWVGEQAGIRPTMGWDAYTVSYAKWFADNGRWGQTPKPGAVVFFDWGGSKDIDAIDHVGLVKKDNGDGTITTIEGNTGNGKVEERVRPVAQVDGYGYPVYNG